MHRSNRPNAVTILAGVVILALALTGTATAAKLIRSKDIKNGTIKSVDLAAATKRALTGQRGATGPAGPQGPQGPAGPSVLGQMTVVRSPQVPFGAETVQGAVALCPAGQRAISGGGATFSDEQLAATEPTADRGGWFVIGVDFVENPGDYVQATALCVPTGQAVAASAPSRARARAELERMIAKVAAAAMRYPPAGGRRGAAAPAARPADPPVRG